jgi:hypothetical protein
MQSRHSKDRLDHPGVASGDSLVSSRGVTYFPKSMPRPFAEPHRVRGEFGVPRFAQAGLRTSDD